MLATTGLETNNITKQKIIKKHTKQLAVLIQSLQLIGVDLRSAISSIVFMDRWLTRLLTLSNVSTQLNTTDGHRNKTRNCNRDVTLSNCWSAEWPKSNVFWFFVISVVLRSIRRWFFGVGWRACRPQRALYENKCLTVVEWCSRMMMAQETNGHDPLWHECMMPRQFFF